MELNKIETLVNLYFEGETSLAQEQALREYFTSDKVAPHLEEYRPMFTAFAEAKQGSFNRNLELPNENPWKQWLPIAATIAVILGVLFFGQNNFGQAPDYGTYDNPDVAALKAKQTLQAISGMINEGTSQLSVINTFEEESNKYLK
ncbi:MAG: hypothetical protein WBG71_01270 [Leeuwenhoekiella sp.]